jgi:hypothetical protein
MMVSSLHPMRFAVLLLAGFPLALSPADLSITDSHGTVVAVRSASIDYSSLFSSDIETDAIRVLQGDGVIVLKWADVDTLKVTKIDESVTPPRIELSVLMRSGKRTGVTLLRKGHMKLSGKSDLGDYSIDLDKVRLFVPAR